jgi:hypothetical protein
MSDASLVATVALWMAGISLALYIIEALFAMYKTPVASAGAIGAKAADTANKAAAPTIEDVSKLVEAQLFGPLASGFSFPPRAVHPGILEPGVLHLILCTDSAIAPRQHL